MKFIRFLYSNKIIILEILIFLPKPVYSFIFNNNYVSEIVFILYFVCNFVCLLKKLIRTL